MENNKLHNCETGFGKARDAAYGPAIYRCWEDGEGILWVDNDEYASQVNYCPYCGYEAKIKIKD
jgi:DNA-directed RNA polymerase subunit RPC12/RpoP